MVYCSSGNFEGKPCMRPVPTQRSRKEGNKGIGTTMNRRPYCRGPRGGGGAADDFLNTELEFSKSLWGLGTEEE